MKEKLKDRGVYIVAYGRTAVARAFKGSLANSHPIYYAGELLRSLLEKYQNIPSDEIDDILLGCARPEGKQGSNPARLVALYAGISPKVPALTLTRFCSSGLQTIMDGANSIKAEEKNLVVAGGLEYMSGVAMGTPEEFRLKDLEESPVNPYLSMGVTAENVAKKYNITREEMDKFAVESHKKADKAQQIGAFESEILPIKIGEDFLSKDEGIRPNSSVEKLSKLKPVFCEDGLVTAATSSQMSDGAAFVVLASGEAIKKHGLEPLAEIISYSTIGLDPSIMGMGPLYAVPKALERANLNIDDIDVIEINEAFASQSIACIRELRLNEQRVNPRGGAIALGHPLGATGAVLMCKIISELKDFDKEYGLITLCVGGGMGAAMIIRNL